MLRECLLSLRASLGPEDELLVGDSASSDPDVRVVAAEHGATYLRAELAGASRARNVGWRAARHDVIAFVDDDVRVGPGWATALGRVFASRPSVTFVTGRIRLPPGMAWTDVPVSTKDAAEPAVLEKASTGVLGHSANLAIRRHDFHARARRRRHVLELLCRVEPVEEIGVDGSSQRRRRASAQHRCIRRGLKSSCGSRSFSGEKSIPKHDKKRRSNGSRFIEPRGRNTSREKKTQGSDDATLESRRLN